ncbi:hypothetical protein GGP41_010256 [Bipolaris sorokiniana]|uniref:Uncharacterized protein n=1 Tax=Cochliobolus sativus TaxID=45130 RepID=A0A8H6DXX9_COCSA|nr:hypothetical protein GGP41_010256 [Bipolaris sorokiniana]
MVHDTCRLTQGFTVLMVHLLHMYALSFCPTFTLPHHDHQIRTPLCGIPKDNHQIHSVSWGSSNEDEECSIAKNFLRPVFTLPRLCPAPAKEQHRVPQFRPG